MKRFRFVQIFQEHSPILWQIPGPIILIGSLLLEGKFLFWGTSYLQFLPWRVDAWRMITQGILPLWSSQIGMGAPLFANYQSALLYPPNILVWLGAACCSIKGIAFSQTILVIIHLIASGIGMVFLMREIGFGKLAQTISGLSFSLSGYLLARASFLSMNAVLVWIPWLLWFSLRWLRAMEDGNWKVSTKYIFLYLISFACQLLGGHAQLTWYSQMIVLLWVFIFTLSGKRSLIWKKICIFGLISLLAIGISAIQLLPTAEYLSESQRSQSVDEGYALNYSFWPWRFLTLFSPDLFGNPGRNSYWVTADNYWEDAIYIGFIPVMLAISGILLQKKNLPRSGLNLRLIQGFMSGISLTGIVLALGKNLFVFPFLYHNIPTFNLFQGPSRFSIWIVLGLSVLIGFGLENWEKPTGKKLYWSRLGAMAGAGAVITALLAQNVLINTVQQSYLIGVLHTSILFFVFMLFNLFAPEKGTLSPIWSNLLVVFILIDLIYAHSFINPGISFSSLDKTEVKPRAASTTGRMFLSPQDESDIKFNRFFRFDTFLPANRWNTLTSFYIPNSNILNNKPAVNNFDPLVPLRYEIWMEDVMNQPTLVTDELLRYLGVDEKQMVTLDTGEIGSVLIENPSIFHFYSCAEFVQKESESLAKVKEKIAFGEISSKVIVEKADITEQEVCLPTESDAEIQIEIDQSNRQQVRLVSSGDGWLMQSQVWYPGWHAYLNGNQVTFERMDYLFRGIKVPAGRNIIQFIYEPSSIRIGSWISGISILVTMIGLAYLSRRRKPDDNE